MAEQLLNRGTDVPVTLTCLTTDVEPTGYSYNSRLFKINAATLKGTWWIYTPSGWVQEDGPAVSLSALPAGTNNIGKVTLEGEIPAGTKVIGGVTFPGTVQADIAAMKAKIDTIQADIATIKTTGTPVSTELPAGTKNIGDMDVLTLPGTVQADIAESKRQLTAPVLFPMSGAATHTISATAAQLISFVLQSVNAGIITVKDGDTTLLTFAAGALSPGQAVFIGAMMTNPKIVFAGADVGVATYIPTAS